MKKKTPDRLLLAHGSGGRLTHELVTGTFLPALDNPILACLSDAAILPELPPGRPALTTDGFVVDPPIFPGGDLGYLSVCGTVNDLSVAGARPLWLTWGLILEEGADGDLIRTCAEGTARAASEAGVQIVAGDTKVVPRGKGDRIYAVTAGLGVVPPGREISDLRIEEGDVVIASGPLGDHGATIMATRHDLDTGDLCSDAAPLTGLIESVFDAGIDLHSMHDPTRGGVLTVCNEVAERSGKRIVLTETAIPVRPQVRAICEVLGLQILGLACEGRVLAWVSADQADRALKAFQSHPQGRGAAIFARVEGSIEGEIPVVMETEVGSTRPLDMLSGTDLPRIC
jgi:hydrogenase expression/formation protein HypE